MAEISVSHLTKDYGQQRGVFDVSFEIEKGEIYGYLGPNGAGKSTTIRHLLGFIRPAEGQCTIHGLDCWTQQAEIQKNLGYLPGEIAFPAGETGLSFIKSIAKLRDLRDMSKADDLMKRFELDPRGSLKRMSKGMKQKVALVIAFMHDPDIIILDEPTTGLDPLMQERFVALVKEEKERGKTILMSSHMFDEVEKTCDRLAIIKSGKIVANVDMREIANYTKKEYEIKFATPADYAHFLTLGFPLSKAFPEKDKAILSIEDADTDRLIAGLGGCHLVYLKQNKLTLEQYFMNYYQEEQKHE